MFVNIIHFRRINNEKRTEVFLSGIAKNIYRRMLLHICHACISKIGSAVPIFLPCLTHWGRVTHICVSNLTIIGSDNGLSSRRRPAIIWTNAGISFIGPLGPDFSFNRNSNIFIQENAFESVVWEMASILSRPQCVNGTCEKLSTRFTYCRVLLWLGTRHVTHNLQGYFSVTVPMIMNA